MTEWLIANQHFTLLYCIVLYCHCHCHCSVTLSAHMCAARSKWRRTSCCNLKSTWVLWLMACWVGTPSAKPILKRRLSLHGIVELRLRQTFENVRSTVQSPNQMLQRWDQFKSRSRRVGLGVQLSLFGIYLQTYTAHSTTSSSSMILVIANQYIWKFDSIIDYQIIRLQITDYRCQVFNVFNQQFHIQNKTHSRAPGDECFRDDMLL